MIADRRDLQSVEHAVARILAQSDQPVEVYEAALEAIGRPLGWEFGAVWEVDRRSGALHCIRTWNIAEGAVLREFVALTERLTFGPGVGLPGRVLETGQAAWIFDAPEDGNSRARRRRSGRVCTPRSASPSAAPEAARA